MEIAVPLPDVVGHFEESILSGFSTKIEEWSRCRQALTKWEERYLLVDAPEPSKLAEHKRIVEKLIFFGQVFAFVTSHPDFPDTGLADSVHSVLWVFREKFQMFHNPMNKERADRLLQEVFPES